MGETLFITHDWPRAIIHVEGDAFFASCEEAIQPALREKAMAYQEPSPATYVIAVC